MKRNRVFYRRKLLHGLLNTAWVAAVCIMAFPQGLHAQSSAKGKHSISGTVYEAGTGKKTPLSYASILIQQMGTGTISADNGTFMLKDLPAGKVNITVQSLGMVKIDTTLVVSKDITHLEFYMKDANFAIKEIVVTATANKAGQATSSTIARTAMDHMQATSLSDILQLLPGGVAKNQDLNYTSQINIRTLSTDGSNMNGLGSLIVKDGVPLSNNANMQVLNPSLNGATVGIGGLSGASGGVDLRPISLDNVESVEVIRGIPSVQYGDLTSGAVIVTSKAGREPYKISFKTNPNIVQTSVNKGYGLGTNKGNLNISADYAYNIKQPSESYAYYQRATAQALYSNSFFNKRLRSNTSLEFTFGENRRKKNPDDETLQLAERGKEAAVKLSTNGTFNMNYGWLKNIRYALSANYSSKKSHYETVLGTGNYPYSMTTTDGAVLSNKPGVDVYDSEGNKITNIPAGEENLYAYYTPSSYMTKYDIDGKEVNTFAQVIANLVKNTEYLNNRISLGASFKSDGNVGDGKTFDPSAPPYRITSVNNSSSRPRSYKDIPFVHQLSAFAEENFSYSFGQHELKFQAGARYDNILGFRDIITPRANLSIDVIPSLLTLRGGYGVTAKSPTVLYLHPEDAYFEYINLNTMASSTVPEAQRMLVTTTRVFDTKNRNLKIATNKKTEIGLDITLSQKMRLSVTGFKERMNNGYYMNDVYTPVTYQTYTTGTLPTDGTSFPTLIADKQYSVLSNYSSASNNLTVNTDGVELDFNTGRIDAIRTAFVLSGAWMQSETYNNGYTYYSLSATDPAKASHIGMYEPGMKKRYQERISTSLRMVHNIPSLKMAVTLTTQVIWKDADWYKFSNDSVPVKYINKNDGQVYDFDPANQNSSEFASIMRKVEKKEYIKESMPPLLCMNLNLSKEIGEYMRVSFFANNMFSSHPLYEDKRSPGTYERRNNNLFFGVELLLTLK
nr:carboxypeptidase-like regulatory domain-containing protein [uncultured Bacteroides sp.]